MKPPAESTILVVDDEAGLRKAIAFEFERKGYRVLTAESGNTAQTLLKGQPVDVVISDLRMPDGDGVDLLKWIKRNQSSTPFVIFITAYADLSIEDAYALGASAIFSKPFDRKSLRDAVTRCLTPPLDRWRMDASESMPLTPWPQSECEAIATVAGTRLGTGGMFIAHPGPFPKPETRIRFSIPSPISSEHPQDELRGSGIIRWVRTGNTSALASGCGIEFLQLEDSGRITLAEYLLNSPDIFAFIPAA